MIHIFNLNVLESQRIQDENEIFNIKGVNVAHFLEELNVNANLVVPICDDDFSKYQDQLAMFNYTLITGYEDTMRSRFKKHQITNLNDVIQEKLLRYVRENVMHKDKVVIVGEILEDNLEFIENFSTKIKKKTPILIVDVDNITFEQIDAINPSAMRLQEKTYNKLFNSEQELQEYMNKKYIEEIFVTQENLNARYYTNEHIFEMTFPYEIHNTDLVHIESLIAGYLYAKKYKYKGLDLLKRITGTACLVHKDESPTEEALEAILDIVQVEQIK